VGSIYAQSPSDCQYFTPFVLKSGTWVAIPGASTEPGNFLTYARKELACDVFVLHRSDVERFYESLEAEKSCKESLANCSGPEQSFFNTPEGRVVIGVLGFAAGVAVSVAIYSAVNR